MKTKRVLMTLVLAALLTPMLGCRSPKPPTVGVVGKPLGVVSEPAPKFELNASVLQLRVKRR